MDSSPPNPAPSPDSPTPPRDLFLDPEEWTLDDPAPARVLPAQPIAAAPPHPFESAPRPAVPSPAPQALPPVASALSSPQIPYDPFQIDDELPSVPAAAAPPRASPATTAPLPEPEPEPADQLPAPRRALSGALAALVLAALAAIFGSLLYSQRPAPASTPAHRSPSLPLAGKSLTLSELSTAWRLRQPSDRVSTVDVVLPSPSRAQPTLLPQVQFTCDPAKTKTGFLRFLFLDPEGKISGDVRVLKLSAGAIDPLNSGAVSTGPSTAIVYGSLGFMDDPSFVSYATGADGDTPRWTVEISESADYNAKEEGWTRLETLEIQNRSAP